MSCTYDRFKIYNLIKTINLTLLRIKNCRYIVLFKSVNIAGL